MVTQSNNKRGSWTARLDLTFHRDEERTYLAKQFYNLPLQVLPPHYQDEDGTAFVYLLNPSGGILQGDRLQTKIKLEKGASVVATTTASTKYYKMEEDDARVENRMILGPEATLEYLPDHGVPFRKTNVTQENIFYIDETSTLITWDAVTSGRKARGESFDYTRFCTQTSLYVGERLVLRDRMDLRPREEPVDVLGSLEGYDILGGMYLYQKGAGAKVRESIAKENLSMENTRIGVSAVDDDLVVVRLLGRSILEYKECMRALWSICRPVLLHKNAVRIRKY